MKLKQFLNELGKEIEKTTMKEKAVKKHTKYVNDLSLQCYK